MSLISKALLALALMACMGLSVLWLAVFGFQSSAQSNPFSQTMSIIGVFVAVLSFAVSCYWMYQLLIKNRQVARYIVFLFVTMFFLSFFGEASLNCTRCVPEDSRSRTAVDRYFGNYELYYLDKNRYEQEVRTGTLDTDNYSYKRFNRIYLSEAGELCVKVKIKNFIGIPISDGEPYCVSSDPNAPSRTKAYTKVDPDNPDGWIRTNEYGVIVERGLIGTTSKSRGLVNCVSQEIGDFMIKSGATYVRICAN